MLWSGHASARRRRIAQHLKQVEARSPAGGTRHRAARDGIRWHSAEAPHLAQGVDISCP